METKFRRLPSVYKILSEERIRHLQQLYPHSLLLELTRRHLDRQRSAIAQGNPPPSIDDIVAAIYDQLDTLEKPSLRPVINASGVILHTNLGRAPMSKEAVAAMATISSGYCNLEFNLDSGTRGSRHIHIEPVLCQLSGAEAALVVNNNASAVLLGLIALAKRKEVIVSRGQAVEIGGGFRIPDVMRQSGAKLVEVGTTNCTYIADYQQAIGPRTAALMRVHASNFKVTGFTHEVTLEEIVTLGRQHELPVLDDLGSGCFLDTTRFGLDPEPMVQQSIAIGAGLTFFSGDKLVGGPQAGIIVGKKPLIDKLKKHPLARAVRIDKTRQVALAATLIHYLKDEAINKVPIWRMIAAPLEEIERRARLWAQSLPGSARVIDGETMIGGGSLPGGSLPTKLVAIAGQGKKKNIAQVMSQRLRSQQVPIIGRLSDNVLLLDPRSVLPEEEGIVLQALERVAAGVS